MSPIAKLLSHYGATRVPSGRGWRSMKCPFHSDRHASATVNNEVNAFNCFTCDIKGDIFKVVMIQEGVDFLEAKSRIQSITGAGDELLSSAPKLGRRISSKQGSIATRRKQISFGSSEGTSRRARNLRG
jgi:DNA primase